jgi:hypothetical protein
MLLVLHHNVVYSDNDYDVSEDSLKLETVYQSETLKVRHQTTWYHNIKYRKNLYRIKEYNLE